MATVNHVIMGNLGNPSYQGNTMSSRGWWGLTRALKKAGWKYKASSNGTTYEFSGDPALDKYGAGQPTNTGASAASIGAVSAGRAIITGLTGIVAADKGRFLLISGAATAANNHQHQIEEVLSSTSVRVDARQFAVASDANNGSLTWSILDPCGDAWYGGYVSLDAAIGWWCAQGPSVLKIPITAAAVGTFKRGENLTQSTTGAQGELVGYTYYNGTGWLVVMPRVRGTGTGVHGWQTSYVITGDKSLATVTQNGTAIDFVYEIVVAKATGNLNHVVLLTQVDTVAESAQQFSVQAAGAGCTATVHPGGAASGANLFGTKAWVVLGSSALPAGTTASTTAASSWPLISAVAMVADAIPEAGYSADGSYNLVFFTNYIIAINAAQSTAFGLQRLDDTEDGEIAIYTTYYPHYNVGTAPNRTAFVPGTNDQYGDTASWSVMTQAITSPRFASWRARGMASEAFTTQHFACRHSCQTLNSEALTASTTYMPTNQYAMHMTLTATANPSIRQLQPLRVAHPNVPRTVRGSLRWIYAGFGSTIGSYQKVRDRGFFFGSGGQRHVYNPSSSLGHGDTAAGLFYGPYDGSPLAIFSAI